MSRMRWLSVVGGLLLASSGCCWWADKMCPQSHCAAPAGYYPAPQCSQPCVPYTPPPSSSGCWTPPPPPPCVPHQ
jgi:hypothetical protein